MKLAFITGITGQDGYYLTKFLLSKNYKVYGIVRRTSELYCSSRIYSLENNITLKYGDLTDKSSLQCYINDIITQNRFDVLEIYNLGAQSHVKVSFDVNIGSFLKFWTWYPALRKDRFFVSLHPKNELNYE